MYFRYWVWGNALCRVG